VVSAGEALIWTPPNDPFSRPNPTDISNAYHLSGTRRQGVYTRIETVPQYYTFDVEETGDLVYVELSRAPQRSEDSFWPGIVLMGPAPLQVDFPSNAELPSDVDVPLGYDYRVLRLEEDIEPDGTFEGLPPSAYFELVTLSMNELQAGIYFVAVFSHETPGNYVLIYGVDKGFSFVDFLGGALIAADTWSWAGVNIGIVLIPLILTIVGGIALMCYEACYKRHSPQTWYSWVVCLGAFVVMGQAWVILEMLVMFIFRTSPSSISTIWVSVIFIVLIFIVSLIIIFLGLLVQTNVLVRILLVVLALGCIALWAGYYVGPLMIIVGALLPTTRIPFHKCFPCLDPFEDDEYEEEDENEDGPHHEPGNIEMVDMAATSAVAARSASDAGSAPPSPRDRSPSHASIISDSSTEEDLSEVVVVVQDGATDRVEVVENDYDDDDLLSNSSTEEATDHDE